MKWYQNFAGLIVLGWVITLWAAYHWGCALTLIRERDASAKVIAHLTRVSMHRTAGRFAAHLVEQHGVPLDTCGVLAHHYQEAVARQMASEMDQVITFIEEEGPT